MSPESCQQADEQEPQQQQQEGQEQQSPETRPRTTSVRPAHCSHTTMDRVFSSKSHHVECDRCGGADFGWIYKCTQDEKCSGSSSLSSAIIASPSYTIEQVPLNDWVVRAIAQGHYTEDQIEKLRIQKSKVLELVTKGTRCPPIEEDETGVPTNEGLKTLFNYHDTFCRLYLCPYCFPSGRERTWTSLNEVCARPPDQIDVPFHISEIPGSDIRQLRPKENRDGSNEEDGGIPISALAGVSINENGHRYRSSSNGTAQPDDYFISLNLATSSDHPFPSSQCDVETLIENFRSYKKQPLGKPMKVSKTRLSPGQSNENAPLEHKTRPKLTRKPKWNQTPAGIKDHGENDNDNGGWTDTMEMDTLELNAGSILTQA